MFEHRKYTMSVDLNFSNIVDSEVYKLLNYTNSYLNLLTVNTSGELLISMTYITL